MKLKLAQLNFQVGDFQGNRKKMSEVISGASSDELVLFPECSLTGYPQQDLLDYPAFAKEAERHAQELISDFPDKSFIFGSIERNQDKGRPLRNIALFVDKGKLAGKYAKRLLPTYDVFDEDRFFEPGREALVVEFQGVKIGITICEDIWSHDAGQYLQNRYKQNPIQESVGADVLLNLSASPFEYKKVESKKEMLKRIARTYKMPLIYVNAVGANDSLIFDGRSYVLNASGEICVEMPAYTEELREISLPCTSPVESSSFEPIKEIYDALILGIRDYCQKTGFSAVGLGLSGGIDSSLVACLAADALGAANVTGVMMPSRYTTKESSEDALQMAIKMQNPLHILAIEEIFAASLRTLEYSFKGRPVDFTEENLQARIRGNILMGLANKFGLLVLTTGNKSEIAVGYCTIYGDMNGALAPLADVYKTQVYELAREANRRWNRIPERVFTRAPSAELRENQTDQDSLPPYEKLDGILQRMIEGFQSKEEICQAGFDREHVDKAFHLFARSEFKRYQMPLGLKISSKAFGVGRRMPLVEKFFN